MVARNNIITALLLRTYKSKDENYDQYQSTILFADIYLYIIFYCIGICFHLTAQHHNVTEFQIIILLFCYFI